MMSSEKRLPVRSESPALRRASRALLPDLAALGGILALAISLLGARGSESLLGDSDTGWHIIVGQRIAATGEVPRQDPFSFSKPNGKWYAYEWLCDVVLGRADAAFGLRGVVFLAGLTLGVSVWTSCRLSRVLGSDPLFTGLLAGLALTVSQAHWLARPHLLSWVLLVGWIWQMEAMPDRLRPRHVIGAVATVVLWTNTHGSFLLVFPIAVIYGLGYCIQQRRRAVSVAAVTACCFVATFVNPYGIRLHGHLVRFLLNAPLLAYVAEYQSFDFHSPGGWPVMAVFFIAMAGVVVAMKQRRWPQSLLLLMLLVIAFRSVRGIPLLALAGLPVASAALTRALRDVDRLRPLFAESATFGAMESQLNGFALATAAALLAWWILGWPSVQAAVRFPAARYPTTTDRCIEQIAVHSRVYSPDYLGGFLIYRFQGERKVFADGRVDYYGIEFLKDYVKIMSVQPGWRQLFRGSRLSHALLPRDAPLRDALQREGWEQLCEDQATVLLARGSADGP